MQEIHIPKDKLEKWYEADRERFANECRNKNIFDGIQDLNKSFFRACRQRINRKLRRSQVSYGLDVGLRFCGKQIFGMAELTVYLGDNQTMYLRGQLKKTSDVDRMCENAIKVVAVFEPNP